MCSPTYVFEKRIENTPNTQDRADRCSYLPPLTLHRIYVDAKVQFISVRLNNTDTKVSANVWAIFACICVLSHYI